MNNFIEIQNKLIRIDDIVEVEITPEDTIVIIYKDRKYNSCIDYSDVLDDVNDEREIDKDYKRLSEALVNLDNIQEYKDKIAKLEELFYKIYSICWRKAFPIYRLKKVQNLILDYLK